MNTNLRKSIRSMQFILRSTNLLYNLAQYKYVQYYNLLDNVRNLICASDQDLNATDIVSICFVDNRNFFVIQELKKQIARSKTCYIICTYRCYEYINLNLQFNNIIKIKNSLMYDLNISRVNRSIYDEIKLKLEDKIEALYIKNIYIDGSSESLNIESEMLQIPDWNNLNGGIVIGRYILYMLTKFMSKYFLLEVGKNKQAKDKIENKIKDLKLQLINSNIVVKKQIEYE